MTFNDISGYFENYATLHVDIRHSDANKAFVAVHNDKSADDFIKTCKAPVIMVLLTPEKLLLPPKGENYNWDKDIYFFILKHCGRDPESGIIQAQNDCEIIVNDFVTRMIDDRYTLLRSINEESIFIKPVGPMSDDLYGQCCKFELIDGFDYQVDPARWLQPGP